ncbi:FCD domain-containing protein [Agrobacterium vitis]|uniref:FadR/GntR family transcriptional regulator n=1 Tax=Agrobacterium vitis TaxID=373 RepID=UPI000871B629|nr:FadR/GntR family transcriptional regulator [Agrobacterium vitis]MCE6077389.1 FCD domain-containing protein [Agrobacterium vitis]MCF1452494.1 FadR family transcriptional regulator [Agrobacterium vitis]MCF1465899.1 FadR family transcriptional regulator [Agrobacterium vitis]MCM2452382.1 FadR family transcriptional regulator [Agrobacterium vitis]MCM2468511.1 FadR family transcriptional regulator [Agrobacterium vitis]
MTLPKRLYQQIADQVRHLIQSGPYPAGSRLPPERELAQTLGVSRPSLREALIALEIDGTIEIRMGSGIYVLSASKSAASGRSLGESPTELMQARAVIESAVIVKAAGAMTDAAFAALVGIVELMRQEIAEGRKPIDQDRQFHLTIAEQSGNSVLAEIVANLFDERHSPISDHIRGRFETPETWSLALIEHEAILNALEARDPLAAQAAMYAHLTASRRRWLEN